MADLRYINRLATQWCNTRKRIRHAFRLGCDSIDGSGFSRWPDERLPQALRWLAVLHGTPPLPSRPAVRDFLHLGTAAPSLLDGTGLVVQSVAERQGRYQVLARLAYEPERCPGCGIDGLASGLVYRHGVLTRWLYGLPRKNKPVAVRIDRQRYRCRSCGKTFLQPLASVPGRGALSQALEAFILDQSQSMPCTAIARTVGVHEKTIRNLLADSQATRTCPP